MNLCAATRDSEPADRKVKVEERRLSLDDPARPPLGTYSEISNRISEWSSVSLPVAKSHRVVEKAMALISSTRGWKIHRASPETFQENNFGPWKSQFEGSTCLSKGIWVKGSPFSQADIRRVDADDPSPRHLCLCRGSVTEKVPLVPETRPVEYSTWGSFTQELEHIWRTVALFVTSGLWKETMKSCHASTVQGSRAIRSTSAEAARTSKRRREIHSVIKLFNLRCEYAAEVHPQHVWTLDNFSMFASKFQKQENAAPPSRQPKSPYRSCDSGPACALWVGYCSSPTLFPGPRALRFLGWKRISNNEEVKETVEKWLSEVEWSVYDEALKGPVSRLKKSIEADSDYVEK
ncbi:hypothetical protein AAG570_009435 [Ranatra chinensis]|uniref:Uncharacterized protein n=1 Tax=Ranatra chinensis TaxID=642074 RepID=A0ABD0YP35_9HEMI